MSDGEGHWAAIAELRNLGAKHDREVGVLDSRVAMLKEDVNGLGEETRKTRHEMRNQISATELRVTDHVDERVGDLEKRIDRLLSSLRWVIGLSVPAVCTLLGLLIGRS